MSDLLATNRWWWLSVTILASNRFIGGMYVVAPDPQIEVTRLATDGIAGMLVDVELSVKADPVPAGQAPSRELAGRFLTELDMRALGWTPR